MWRQKNGRMRSCLREAAAPETETVGQQADGDGCEDVYDRVLLQKDCGDGDQHRGQGEGDLPGRRLKRLNMPGGAPYCHRANHMERWANIGIRIKQVIVGEDAGKDIVPLKGGWPKLLTVWEHQIDQERNRVGDNNKQHQLAKSRNVIKECVDMHPDQVKEPEQIGDEKVFAKGNQVIQCAVDGEVR